MTDETPDAAPDPAGAVALAYVHDGEHVSYSWHYSMVQLIGYDMANEARIMRGGFIGMLCGTDGLVHARNLAVAQFLDEGTADWLLWIDTDMGFPPDVVERLMAAADPEHRPIVGALAFSQRQYSEDGTGGWLTRAAPTVMDWKTIGKESGFDVRWDYSRNTVTKVDGTGSACILIHRSVFEKMRAEFGEVWYSKLPNPSMGQMTSEDLSFCMRAGALEIPVHVHTGVKTTHHKPVWLGEDHYLRERAVNEALENAAKAGGKS